MIAESTDVIATILVLVVPFALALFVVVLVVAYPWLLLIPLGIWYLVVKHGLDEVPPANAGYIAVSTPDAGHVDSRTDADMDQGMSAGPPTGSPTKTRGDDRRTPEFE